MFVILNSSCSSFSGPDGYFPSTRYDFLYEEIEKDQEFHKEKFNIEELNLNSNNIGITDENLILISKLIEKTNKIKSLFLSDNKIVKSLTKNF